MLRYFTSKYLIQAPRILKYKFLSDCKRISGQPIYHQPALLTGLGQINFGDKVMLGYTPSPFFYNGYIHLEARSADGNITIGDGVHVNNNFFAICDHGHITIGKDTLIGVNCQVINSDFHEIHPSKRTSGNPVSEDVVLGTNVFLGNNVIITKGVTLGDNVVVANSAVVTRSFPDNVIIGGIPAKVIGQV